MSFPNGGAFIESPPASSSAVEVVSCKFLRYNCDHPVFQKEYTRRVADLCTLVFIRTPIYLQILRCFPHCCPDHIPRCYCGCSIHLLVTFKDASVVNDSDIVICARFEASSSEYQSSRGDDGSSSTPVRKLVVGELVTLPVEVLQSVPQESVESLWIRAYREGDGKQQNVPENSILYVMNNYRFPKWYYNYESGATKSQREMKHYLRAYVMRLERPTDLSTNWSGSRLAFVVARHASPGFTLVSYRRAGDPNAANKQAKPVKDNVDKATVLVDSSTESEHEESVPRPTNLFVQAAPPASLLGHHVEVPGRHDHGNAEGILLGLRYGDQGTSFLTASTAPEEQQHSFLSDSGHSIFQQPQIPVVHQEHADQPLERHLPRDANDRLYWRQPKSLQTLEHARQLSILQYFVTRATVDELWSSFMNLEDRLRESWIEPIYNQTRDLPSRESLARFRVPSPSHQRHQHQRDQLSLFGNHPVVALCAEVAVELSTSRALHDFARLMLQVDSVSPTSHKGEVRGQFATLVDGVYSHLSMFLAERRAKAAMTMADLVDEIVTLVHQNQRFRWMQLPIKELLVMATPDKFLFEAFCAQAREQSVSKHHSSKPQVNSAASADVHSFEQWNQRWLIDSRSLRLRDVHRDATRQGFQYRGKAADEGFQFSAWEVLSTIQQFGAIDVELDDSASLRIRSVFRSATQVLCQPMELILDGKYRIFRTFPNGMSTMAVARDGWMYGDYFGYLESPFSIKIWFFASKRRTGGNGANSVPGGSSPARCIAVYLMRSESGRPWQFRYGGPDTSSSSDQLHVSVKIDDAICPSVGVDDDDKDNDGLVHLPIGARHSIWKSLHWKPSAEFDVEYQQLMA